MAPEPWVSISCMAAELLQPQHLLTLEKLTFLALLREFYRTTIHHEHWGKRQGHVRS